VHSSQPPVIELKTKSEIDIMREAGRAVAQVLQILCKKLEPGISTGELDKIAFQEIRSLGMKPAFLGYRGYPATACISINEELVHGIPSTKRVVHAGDIVTVDMGVIHNGYYGDAAATFPVGNVTAEASKLLQVTRNSLDRAIDSMKPGNRLGDVSWAIQRYVEAEGFSVVRDYVGHGIGRKLHEDPPVPNFGKQHTGPRLAPGMVLAIEPMVNCGGYQVRTLDDEWTVVTVDGRLCAHFEHMVAVTDEGCEVLTVL
jgi:methionyl aminopeptidase